MINNEYLCLISYPDFSGLRQSYENFIKTKLSSHRIRNFDEIIIKIFTNYGKGI